jgi:hypothetical protein
MVFAVFQAFLTSRWLQVVAGRLMFTQLGSPGPPELGVYDTYKARNVPAPPTKGFYALKESESPATLASHALPISSHATPATRSSRRVASSIRVPSELVSPRRAWLSSRWTPFPPHEAVGGLVLVYKAAHKRHSHTRVDRTLLTWTEFIVHLGRNGIKKWTTNQVRSLLLKLIGIAHRKLCSSIV